MIEFVINEGLKNRGKVYIDNPSDIVNVCILEELREIKALLYKASGVSPVLLDADKNEAAKEENSSDLADITEEVDEPVEPVEEVEEDKAEAETEPVMKSKKPAKKKRGRNVK